MDKAIDLQKKIFEKTKGIDVAAWDPPWIRSFSERLKRYIIDKDDVVAEGWIYESFWFCCDSFELSELKEISDLVSEFLSLNVDTFGMDMISESQS